MSSTTTTIHEIENPAAPRFVRERLTWASYWMLGYFAFFDAILGPLMPFMRGDLRLTYTLASLHFSAFALGAVVMGTTADYLTQRWGRRAAFWGGGIGMAAGALLVALTEANVFASGFAFLAPLMVGLVTAVSLSWRLALFPVLALLVVIALRYWSVPFPARSAAHHEPVKATGRRTRLPL